jgi:hypothetical protein
MIRISTYQPPPSEGNSFFFGAIPAIDRLGLSYTSEKVQATEQIALHAQAPAPSLFSRGRNFFRARNYWRCLGFQFDTP